MPASDAAFSAGAIHLDVRDTQAHVKHTLSIFFDVWDVGT